MNLYVLWEDGDELDRGHIYGVFSSPEEAAAARDNLPHSGPLAIVACDLNQVSPRPVPTYSSPSRTLSGLDVLAQQVYVEEIASQLSRELTLREVDGSPGKFVLIEREADK